MGCSQSRCSGDELAKTLIGKLHEQATALSDKRQYGKSRGGSDAWPAIVAERMNNWSKVLVKIEASRSYLKSANISVSGSVKRTATSLK